MRSVKARFFSSSAAAVALAGAGCARSSRPAVANDPRVGLKAGLRDAGEATRNMEQIASLPKPDGFFDPANPARHGDVRRSAGIRAWPPGRRRPTPEHAGRRAPPPGGRPRTSRTRISPSAATTSSMATSTASTTYDVDSARRPRLLASIVCPGGQSDVSVYSNLLFMSVEQTRGPLDCGTQGVHDAGQQGALPRRPHLRHHRHPDIRSRSRRCRPAAARTRTRW